MIRAALIFGVTWLGLVLGFPAWNARATEAGADRIPDIAIVQHARALARIVTPAGASKSTVDTALLLEDYILRSTGVRLEVRDEPAADNKLVEIHCGATAYARGLNLEMGTMDPDGFVISVPDGRHIVLLGAGETGQTYAVYAFLERYVGIRWLFPGAIGEHVPILDALVMTVEEVREKPLFVQRQFIGLGGPENDLWAGRNRMRGRVDLHHNLWRLFTPENYSAAHPEYFPVQNGRRFVPKPAPGKTTEQDIRAQVSWQPCFTAPGSVEETVKSIDAYFVKYPWAASYSLGINDSGGFCECSECMTKDSGRTNALGLRDASPSYYSWCNAVVRGVNRRFPDKKFGLLAYSGVYSPAPGVRLDEHIVPFITYDRMKWVDPVIERKGHALTEEWEKSASVLGWYDYTYGGQFYAAPRLYLHKMVEYLRYGFEHNVRHYYAETYPSLDWHEGPKLYVLLKLLWNPYQDVDALLADWYRAAVGPAAAPYLAEYFSIWEEFWTKRVPDTAWFRQNGDRQYLDFGKSTYLEALRSEDVTKCETLLSKTVEVSSGKAERARAKYFYDGFMARKAQFQQGMSSQTTRENRSP